MTATHAARPTFTDRGGPARPDLGIETPALLGDREFELARRLIAEWAGIKLSPHKRYMVHNRLLRRLRERGVGSFAEYMDTVQSEALEREAFINALTTNLTSFFREPHHFELLRVRAEQHRERERRPLRIWSAACSTGEEAWSIAMTLREAGCPGDVLATDIDTNVLETAAEFVRYVQLLIFTKPFWDSDAGYEALLEGRRLAAEEPTPQPLHALEAQADACVTHDVFDELHRIACKVLVIGGKNDIFTPRWMAEEIAGQIPRCDLHLYDNAGHAFHWECIDDFNPRIVEWFQGR